MKVVPPPGTVTDAGTLSPGLLLERETTVPPVGAATDKATVHDAAAPVPRLIGAQAKELTTADAVRENVAVCALLL